ncbi:heavy-metal-associated domain-containing protein [Pseudonocardia nigra]|uniref:heavy-metal-associated domain-containing protein n=1 Tax=Pseudonocardia nigra TaxID=1921578 RepID=UPI001C5DA5DF|nr:cation transporter [Pseudonocardia nigra]
MSVEAPFRTEVTVSGMSCEHCARSVTEEIREISGVSAVEIELATGAVAVLADRAVQPAEIAAAIGPAGYDLAG